MCVIVLRRAWERGRPARLSPRADTTHPMRWAGETALPTGPHTGKVAGFVYFPFTGKSSSIKSLDLIYGSTVLKLK